MKQQEKDKRRKKWWAILFWILLWQALSVLFRKVYINGHILLASPIESIIRLAELAVTLSFWRTILFSTVNIFGGFLIGCLLGVILAFLSYKSNFIYELLSPVTAAIKSVPVVSFIILALIWVDGKDLSLLISALIVFPPVYLNTLAGIKATDDKLLEMARIFRMSLWQKMRGILLPQLLPYFASAVSAALGMCWKAGVSAEVIGVSSGTIGERLYTSKVYFETADLFAWSVVIVILSSVIEKTVLFLLGKLAERSGLK